MVAKEQEIIEILNHVFGISFADKRDPLNSGALNDALDELGVNLNYVIFSMYKESNSGNVWIIAANKYYEDIDVYWLAKFIVENNLFDYYNLKQDERLLTAL